MAGGAGMQRTREGQHSGQQQPSEPNGGNSNMNTTNPRGYDGPNDSPTSQAGRQNPFPRGLGYDPAKPAPKKESLITNTRVELPSAAYNLDNNFPSSDLPARPGTNTVGKQIQLRVNQYKVSQFPTRDIYQYDIHIGSGAEKRGKVMAVWKSKAVQNKLQSLIQGPWLWDGNKIAWCAFNVPEQRIMVDLDAERGREPRNPPDQVYCIIRQAKAIRMESISAFLNRKMQFDSSVLECINFLDHLMRQWPSEQYTQCKRSFYARGKERFALDNVVEAMKGVYASIRLCDPKPSMGGPATGLAVNVDVANGTFWASQDVHQAARNLLREHNRGLSYTVFRDILLPVKDHQKGGYTQSDDFKNLRKMHKLKFRVKHRGKTDDKKDYVIKGFTWDRDAKYAREGLHSKNVFFKWRNPETNSEESISVFDFFLRKYNIRLEFWYLPLIETTRAGYFPMEVCIIQPDQKYLYKLSAEQTASMIKFAVTRPKERLNAIQHGVGMLKWNEDRYLNYFGLKMDPNMTITQARLLPPPEVQYAGSKATPGTSGRWDLRGKKFLASNTEPLKSWGVCVVGDCTNVPTVRNFLSVFIQTYIGHGGKVQNKEPIIHIMGKKDDLAAGVAATRSAAGNQANCLPQILLFVLPGRDSFMYERLKKNMECRFAMVSQMLNIAHVQKAQPQYCSNVCMKLNAKLGGTSCKVADVRPPKPFFPRPTMIIGADVSHPTPKSPQASVAAITMSFDKEACRYAAAVQTNGYRVEMITEANIKTMLVPLFGKWIQKVGNGSGPQHIYYFRDGVSEGQYDQVLRQEVTDMKKALVEKFGPAAASIKWTVTVCTKRHHIRFFPKENDAGSSDRNGNPLPGTLVERDVTHPFEYDWYLSAHSAIQGTARPVHYHVILDEAQCNVNEFQRLVYNHSYQYMRSTTPVSLFPAVYYAHLASNRARAHESVPSSEGPRGGQKFEELLQDKAIQRGGQSIETGTSIPTECKPLLPLGNPEMDPKLIDGIRLGMWYI